MQKKTISIIGSGPSGLISAYMLADSFSVTIYEKQDYIGGKMFLAARGGLNISKDIAIDKFIESYSPKGFIDFTLKSFDQDKLREWFKELGVDTFIGTSGKIFPTRDIKVKQILNLIKEKLIQKGVIIKINSEFIGFVDNSSLKIKNNLDELIVKSDYYVFALGGASRLENESSLNWIKAFNKNDINTINFEASNCGINIDWPESLKLFHSGKPIKNLMLSFDNKKSLGEIVLTKDGIEGSALYALIPGIRDGLKQTNTDICLEIDLKPNNTLEELVDKVYGRSEKPSKYADYINLSRAQLALVKAYSSKDEFLNSKTFLEKVKSLFIPIDSLRPIKEAISTVGGIDLDELNNDFSLKKMSNTYVIGEMSNWDAPTGGYLLHACFAMGNSVANSIKKRL